MSERIKNFKYFGFVLVGVLFVGAIGTVIHVKNIDNININKYTKNKDDFEYNKSPKINEVMPEKVLLGEEIYLSDEESKLYEKTQPLALIKKILKLSYDEISVKEAETFYEAKYSNGEVISNNPSIYKNIKTENINAFMEEKLNEKKYLTTSTVLLLDNKYGFDYIKEIICFIDNKTYEVVSIAELDSKYDYQNDNLEYMHIAEMPNHDIKELNKVFKEAYNIYNYIDSKKEEVTNFCKENIKKSISKVYIYNRDTVFIKDDNNEKSIMYSFAN